ncbi:unnamed protein product, partial [Ectocarpus sp. 12 AP-2014]
PRWLSSAALFIVSFGLHHETLLGGFVWDDRPAVVGNQDVWAESSWGDIWRHDFWGQQIAHAESHKSFRPLTTVTFKLNNFLAQKISREQQDNTITFCDQQPNDENANSTTTAEFVEKTEDFARGAGPEHTDAAGFHLFNVIVHAATCSSSVWLFRTIFEGKIKLPAVAASLLFTVHPVHVEAVAPIVGRADLLCGFLSVIALSLAIKAPVQNLLSGNNDLSSHDDTPFDDAGGIVAAEALVENSNDATLETRGSVVTMETMKLPAKAVEAPVGYVSSRQHNDEGEKGANVVHRRAWAMAGGASCPPSPVGFKPALTSNMVPGKGAPSMRDRAAIVNEEKDSGPGVTRYCAALLFAAGATLCKEVGITVFGLMAGGEVVRFFEEREWRQRKRKLSQRRRSGVIPTVGKHGIWQKHAIREYLRCQFIMRVPAAAAARFVSAIIFAVLLVYLHVRLHEGARVREWGVLENDISILPSRTERALSYAFTHAVYASKLLWPTHLCYDWGFSCIPHVTSLADSANLASLALYSSILAAVVFAVARCDTVVMWGLALIVVPFLPASNILFPVGAVVAERLLYLPSLGACVLASCTLRCNDGTKLSYGETAAPGNEKISVKYAENSNSNRGNVSTFSSKGGGEDKETNRPLFSPSCGGTSTSNSFGPPKNERGSQQDRSMIPRQPAVLPSSPRPLAARAPACSSSSALLPDPSAREEKQGVLPPRRVLSIRGTVLLPVRHTAVMVLLLAWTTYFGAGTLRRCKDWRSERTLFESAFKVCPDGIKTLNNLAVGMLNVKEAGRAEELLRRAVELHPDFGFAQFNLGVSLMIQRDHLGAVSALERSLRLEPSNTKVMVYLGQASTPPRELSRCAQLDVCPIASNAGDGQTDASNDMRSSSAESLLSSAESYIDRALAAGTGLPLARLVKGQALALRGQHQSAAKFFQESIDISRRLLSGRSAAKIRNNESNNPVIAAGNIEVADAVDLASTYNRLGLALRDSGGDLVATKEAFLAGLSVTPKDFALLVNGGVAHQTAGDVPDAKALFHRALSLQPNSPELLNNLGWLEEQTGGGSKLS